MSLARIDHNPSRRQLNLFGLIWLVFFGVVGKFALDGSGPAPAAIVWGLAVAIPVAGWLLPGFMRIVFLGMSYAAFPIGLVVSYLILLTVYYLVLTPTGLLMRLFGYDPMQRRFDRDAETYWCPREQDDGLERCFRQF